LNDPAPGGPIPWESIFAVDPLPEAELRRQALNLRQLIAVEAQQKRHRERGA
jgi:hypothetical protein